MEKHKTLAYALKQCLPIMAGYLVLGTGFGVLLEAKGYGTIWAVLMSTIIYAGSMQYVAVDLLSSGASLLTAALMTLMVNARHLFYGLSMVDKYRDTKPYKPYLIFALTDETYSIVCSAKMPDGVDEKRYDFYVSLFDQIAWVLGSAAGSLLGGALSFRTDGIEFAMTALFLVVFTQQWMDTKDHTSALTGVMASLGCLLVFGAEDFLIPAMILITILLALFQKKLDPPQERKASHV